MSSLATTIGFRSGRLSLAALGLAVTAIVTWVLAATVNDALFLLAALVGAAAVVLGLKARKVATRETSNGRVALAAAIIGGLVAGQVAAYMVVYGISQLL